jgi:hypothetical protein
MKSGQDAVVEYQRLNQKTHCSLHEGQPEVSPEVWNAVQENYSPRALNRASDAKLTKIGVGAWLAQQQQSYFGEKVEEPCLNGQLP